MKIHRLSAQPSKYYPWNYRIDFGDTKLGIVWTDIRAWTRRMEIPGVWASSTFYTNDQGANIVVLKWS